MTVSVGVRALGRDWFRCCVVLGVGLLLFLLTPTRSRANCPPEAPYNAEVQQLMDSCGNWVCDVSYDPADGYLPEDHPVFPWLAVLQSGTTVDIVNDKLVITGPGGPVPNPDAANYLRLEPALENPATWLYIIQGRYRVRKLFTNTNTQDETLAIMGASDMERDAGFSLRYQDGQRVVVIGQGDYSADPEYVLNWNWEVDTTYTLVVHRGHQIYLSVDGQPMLSRPYSELPENEPAEYDFFAFTSGDAEAEYSWVQYCVCQPALFYKGEVVDQSASVEVLVGAEEKLMVENIRDTPDPFTIPIEDSTLRMEITPLELPGIPSEQFEFTARIIWQVESMTTGEYVKHAEVEIPLSGFDMVEGVLEWNGDDNGSGMPVPAGMFAYKATVQLVRTGDMGGVIHEKTVDEVQTGWRLIVANVE